MQNKMPLRYPLSSFRRTGDSNSTCNSNSRTSSSSSWKRRRRSGFFSHQEALFVLVLAGSLVALVTVLVTEIERGSRSSSPGGRRASRDFEAMVANAGGGNNNGGEEEEAERAERREGRLRAEVNRLAAKAASLVEPPPLGGASVGLAAVWARRAKGITTLNLADGKVDSLRGRSRMELAVSLFLTSRKGKRQFFFF